MADIIDKINQLTGLSEGLQLKLLQSVVLLLSLILLRFLIRQLVWRRTQDVRMRYKWLKTSTYLVTILGLLVIGRVWFQGVQAIVTYLGIVSAGLAIALQDIITNLAGWVFILWRRPFSIGDRIQVGDYAGDVIDIRIFQFTLLEIGHWVDADQSTGRVVHVPNRDVISKTTANYSAGFKYIWDELPVLITFESDWQRAKGILKDIAEQHGTKISEAAARAIREASSRYMIFYRVLTPVVYTDVRDSGVMLTMRYLCDPRRRRAVREEIWEAILTAFGQEPQIDFAYPTQRFYDYAKEGQVKAPPNKKRTTKKTAPAAMTNE